MKTIIWYEARHGTASRTFSTEQEAREEIERAKNGHPENTKMSEESREYWKKVASTMEVTKVTQTTECL